jgi:Flp pilus assembly protein TadB
MLSGRERRTLREIEQRLAVDDPAFAARMRGLPTERRFPTVTVLCVALYIIAPVVLLLAGAPPMLTVFAIFVATTMAVLMSRRRKDRRYRPPSSSEGFL